MKNIIGLFEKDSTITAALYSSYEEWHNTTFSPDTKILACMPLEIKTKGVELWSMHPGRKTSEYKKKQTILRDMAQEWQMDIFPLGNWSFWELYAIENWFEKMGKRYGLYNEFKENAIC